MFILSQALIVQAVNLLGFGNNPSGYKKQSMDQSNAKP